MALPCHCPSHGNPFTAGLEIATFKICAIFSVTASTVISTHNVQSTNICRHTLTFSIPFPSIHIPNPHSLLLSVTPSPLPPVIAISRCKLLQRDQSYRGTHKSVHYVPPYPQSSTRWYHTSLHSVDRDTHSPPNYSLYPPPNPPNPSTHTPPRWSLRNQRIQTLPHIVYKQPPVGSI